MFKLLKDRFRDMGLLGNLLKEAERLANAEGQTEPGAEHMVMAALTAADDDSARRVLASHGASPEAFRAAVSQQYADALGAVGVDATPLIDQDLATPVSAGTGLYKSSESMHDLLGTMKSNKELAANKAFSTAEVILAATRPQFGVVARTFEVLGIDREALAASARAEIVNQSVT